MVIAGVASSGGHLVQLESLIKLGVPINLVMAPTRPLAAVEYLEIPDCNLTTPVKTLLCTYRLLMLLVRTRPDLVISTGAAPGGIALIIARIIGARTIWIDSIANAERASLTGRLAKPFSTIWISQWNTVAQREGGLYIGKIFSFFDSGNSTSV